MKDILVGIDGSTGSRHALDRALRLGRLTGSTVRPVHVWTPPEPRSAALGYLYDPSGEGAAREAEAQQLLDAEVAAGLERMGGQAAPALRPKARAGHVGDVLVDESRDCALVVLGTRGHGRVGSLLGSSVPHVLHQVACPLMVVPAEGGSPHGYRRVVVGVDGSEWSRAALELGYQLAVLESAELVAVHAVARGDLPVHVDELAAWHRSVRSCLLDPDAVLWDVRLLPGGAHAVLTDVAGPDDLLVVGARGAGGFSGLLLGSVSGACVTHPASTVVVVTSHVGAKPELLRPVSAAHSR